MYKIVSKESPEELEKEVVTLVGQGWMPVGPMVPTYKLVKTSRWRETA